jgi:putative transposase
MHRALQDLAVPMARLPRLAFADLPHHLVLRGHNHDIVFVDDTDRLAWLAALRESAATVLVAIHGYVLMPDHVHVLATPRSAEALGLLVQAIGRRYVVAYNRRHGRSGTLWDGRFRASVVEPGAALLACLRCIEQNPVRAGLVAQAADWAWSSAAHHLGRRADALITGLPEYWSLGNTPFEREALWRQMLDEPLGAAEVAEFTRNALAGWAHGSGAFLARLQVLTGRPLQPRPRGRPPGTRAARQSSGPAPETGKGPRG